MASQGWVFTINNYTPEEVELVRNLKCQGMKAEFEVCPTTGTPHIQGAVYFKAKEQKRQAGMKKIFPRAHLEIMMGSWSDQNYCLKDGSVIRNDGTGPSQGARNDLLRCKRRIDEGASELELHEEEFGTMSKHSKFLMRYRDLKRRKKEYRTWMTEGIWYHGTTGVGKSHKVFEDYDPKTTFIFECEDNGWWDGYDGEPYVIINEFRGQIPYAQLLDLVDKWPKKVKRRCMEPTPFLAKRVVVTSSLPPDLVYCRQLEKDSIAQLLRRFKVIELK